MCRTRCVLALIALYVGVVRSWDFATTKEDLLEFYTSGTITESVHFDSQNLTTLIYNEVHNMMLYVNKQSGNDIICGYDISALEKKCFTKRSGRNIHGLAFDPVTEKLFFSDTNERSINWITLRTGYFKNVYGYLLIKMGAGIPTDLAVDSCRGYVYWINTNLTPPTIERVRFDGSDKKVVITSVSIGIFYKLEPLGLAIDQQMQKIYWMEPEYHREYQILYADLNGKNKKRLTSVGYASNSRLFSPFPNTLSVSKSDLYVMSWCWPSCVRDVLKLPKSLTDTNHQYAQFSLSSDVTVGIAANYKLKDKIPKIQDCEALTRLIRDKSDGPFCVHGTKVNEQSLCKCTPGYIGERCDVSVCNNYCMQGDCSLKIEGLPECRCNAGYSGNRCEVDTCYGYCLNNGVCSLNEDGEPLCQCVGDDAGPRCELVQNVARTSTDSSKYYPAVTNLTLADLLSKWRKPKMFVIVEE